MTLVLIVGAYSACKAGVRRIEGTNVVTFKSYYTQLPINRFVLNSYLAILVLLGSLTNIAL